MHLQYSIIISAWRHKACIRRPSRMQQFMNFDQDDAKWGSDSNNTAHHWFSQFTKLGLSRLQRYLESRENGENKTRVSISPTGLTETLCFRVIAWHLGSGQDGLLHFASHWAIHIFGARKTVRVSISKLLRNKKIQNDFPIERKRCPKRNTVYQTTF